MKLVDPTLAAADIVAAPTLPDTDTNPNANPDPLDDPDPAALSRRNGWTPACRRLFFEILAETGHVSRACDYARLSKQSAYALRARDPLFAAGWDAACELARWPLADALYEQAVDGVTETITRDGVIVAERHHHDSRLSIAVLHRLDKRCDRSAEAQAPHLAVVGQWDHWLDLIGKGDDHAARCLLDNAGASPARDSQLGQLPLGDNPTPASDWAAAGYHLEDYYRQDEYGEWTTSCPPPDGFDGVEHGDWADEHYTRDCTPEELDLLLGIEAKDSAAERAEAASRRDRVLADLAAELDALDDPLRAD